jgi:hypothetical protein
LGGKTGWGAAGGDLKVEPQGRLAHPSLESAADATFACWRNMDSEQLAARLRAEIERFERLRRGTSDERLLDEIERMLREARLRLAELEGKR